MRRVSVLVLAIAALAAAANAEDLPGTLQGCLALGLRGHPSLRAARLAVESADARLGEARAGRLPVLAINGSATRLSDEDTGTVSLPAPVGQVSLSPWIEDRASVGASLRQNLFSGFAVNARIAAALAAREAAQSDLLAEEARIAYEIETAWWSLAAAEEARGVVEESRRLVQVHVTESEQFLAQGLATREELLRAASELALADTRLADAASVARLARSRLALFVGLAPGTAGGPTSVEPAAGLAAAAETPLDALVAAALSGAAELAAIDGRIRAGEAAAGGARSGWYPSIALEGAFVWARPNPMLFPPEDRFDATWQIGLSATVNVGGFPAVEQRVREAELEAERMRAQREARVMQVTLEVTEGYESVRRARERIASATAAVARAGEALRVIGGKRAAGLARATELLDGELELMRARLDSSRASADLRIGDAALRRAVGARPSVSAPSAPAAGRTP